MSYENEVKILIDEVKHMWNNRPADRKKLIKLTIRAREIGNATADEWNYCDIPEEIFYALDVMRRENEISLSQML